MRCCIRGSTQHCTFRHVFVVSFPHQQSMKFLLHGPLTQLQYHMRHGSIIYGWRQANMSGIFAEVLSSRLWPTTYFDQVKWLYIDEMVCLDRTRLSDSCTLRCNASGLLRWIGPLFSRSQLFLLQAYARRRTFTTADLKFPIQDVQHPIQDVQHHIDWHGAAGAGGSHAGAVYTCSHCWAKINQSFFMSEEKKTKPVAERKQIDLRRAQMCLL